MWQTFETLWQALAVLNPRLRRRWLLLIPVAFLSAGMEMVATAGMLLLIRLISDPAIAGRSRIFITLSDVLRDRIPLPAGVPFIVPFAVILAVFYLIKNLLRLAETSVQQRCASDTSVWISCGLLERYLRAPYSLHLRRNSSEMLHMVNGAADNVGWEVLQPATALFSEAMIVIGILAVLTLQIPGSAFLTSAITGLVMILLLWSTQRSHTRWGRALHEGDIRLYQTLRQSLGSVKEAKILGRESYFVSRFAEVRSLVSRIHAIRSTLSMVPRLVVETVFVATLAIVVVAAWLRPQGGAGLVATLGIFAFGGLRLLPSLHLIVFRFNQIGTGVAALDTLSCDWESLKAGASAPSISAARPFADSIQFQSVSFAYESGGSESSGSESSGDRRTEPALLDVNLAIHCGESVGIVGPTGAGKTTLVDLMLGLLEPTAGRITVDGWDIRSQLSAWQRQLGYVPQNIYLIDDTIRRNIALGVEDGDIDEGRVVESAHAAQLQEFLKGLPGGLGTVVGERGVKLSGGERQRIAVARALYRRPAILVFDEATAALDNSTEKALTSTIQKLTGNTTMIFIAHRLTTVKWCDRIVFMRQGQILDVGPYEELIERNADFRHLASAMAPTAH